MTNVSDRPPGALTQIQALSEAFVREFGFEFAVINRTWYWLHPLSHEWLLDGAREKAAGYLPQAVGYLDLDKYAWVADRVSQPYTVNRVLDVAARTLRTDRLPGPGWSEEAAKQFWNQVSSSE